MNLHHISHIRLDRQQIAGSDFKTPQDIVEWMGAMQAQNYSMAKWAVGIRLPDASDRHIEEAVNDAKIIRTHLLRPTWHFVSADDIYWMLELTAPRIRTALRSRHKQLELTREITNKSNDILVKALADGNHMTRRALKKEFENAGIPLGDGRTSHLLLLAELEGLICSGKCKGKQQTYAILEERVPKKTSFSKDEALAALAQRYFRSHGPATLDDFTWWSGLTRTSARKALESIKQELISQTIQSKTYWFVESFNRSHKNGFSVHLLPAYDELIISYTDRKATIPAEYQGEAISNNGIFRPVVIVDGQAIGIWKRTIKKNKVSIELELFSTPPENVINLVKREAEAFGTFLHKDPEFSWNLN